MAVSRPSRVAPSRIRWIVAGRWMVLLNIGGRCSATLTGLPTALAASAAMARSDWAVPLPPKPPPIYGEQADVVFGNAEDLAQIAPAPVHLLDRGAAGELIALPAGDAGMRLHHRVRLVRRGVAGIDLDRRGREGRVEVAYRGLRWTAKWRRLRDRRAVQLLRQIVAAGLTHIVHAYQRSGRTRLLEGVGHHHRNGLVIMLDLWRGQEALHVELAGAQCLGVLVGEHMQHAGSFRSGGGVDVRNAPLGDCGADDVAIRQLLQVVVPLVGVRRAARHLERAFDTVHGLADDGELVDGSEACRRVELH